MLKCKDCGDQWNADCSERITMIRCDECAARLERVVERFERLVERHARMRATLDEMGNLVPFDMALYLDKFWDASERIEAFIEGKRK